MPSPSVALSSVQRESAGQTLVTLTLAVSNDSGSQATTGLMELGTATANLTYTANPLTVNGFIYFGARFTGSTPGPTARINSSELRVKNRRPTSVLLSAEVSGFSGLAVPVFTNSIGNISTRTVFSTNETWTATLTPTGFSTSPPLNTVIDSIIHQSGWTAGDPIALRFLCLSPTSVASFANLGATGPELVINYTP